MHVSVCCLYVCVSVSVGDICVYEGVSSVCACVCICVCMCVYVCVCVCVCVRRVHAYIFISG